MENPINYWYQKYIALKAKMDEMMKGAVEHYVIGKIAGSPVGPAIVHYDDNLTIGDKVRLVILRRTELIKPPTMKIEKYEGFAIFPTIIIHKREWVFIWFNLVVTLRS